MNQSTTKPAKISGMFRGAAIGATIAMPILALYTFFAVFEVIEISSPYDFFSAGKTVATIQFIGTLIWAGCLAGCLPSAKRLNISSLGLGLCIAGALIGGILQMIVFYVNDGELFGKIWWSIGEDGKGDGMTLFIVFSILANIPLAIGSFLSGNNLPAMKKATFAYAALTVFPLILLALLDPLNGRKGQTIAIMLFVLLFAGIIVAIMAWWGAVGQAKYLEDDGETDKNGQDVRYNEPVQPSITAEQKNMLSGMSNQELTNVVNNPALYAAGFVDAARKMLSVRQAMVSLNNMTDEQMLAAIHNNPQGFSHDVLDAISMELLRREAPAFINEVASLSTPELQAMVYNAGAYYDGYIKLANRVLNERINLPRKA